jgi:uncharacterized membrane protein YjjB (DUF3815 family)
MLSDVSGRSIAWVAVRVVCVALLVYVVVDAFRISNLLGSIAAAMFIGVTLTGGVIARRRVTRRVSRAG